MEWRLLLLRHPNKRIVLQLHYHCTNWSWSWQTVWQWKWGRLNCADISYSFWEASIRRRNLLKNYQWCFSQWWKLRVTDQGEFELPSPPWRPNFAERACTLFILEPSIDHVTKSRSSTVVFPPKFETNQPNHACDLYVYNWVLLYFQSKIKICELASRTCHDLIYIINCEIDRAKKVFKSHSKVFVLNMHIIRYPPDSPLLFLHQFSMFRYFPLKGVKLSKFHFHWHILGVHEHGLLAANWICSARGWHWLSLGLFTWGWGTLGRWGNPPKWGNLPVHIISFFIVITYTW